MHASARPTAALAAAFLAGCGPALPAGREATTLHNLTVVTDAVEDLTSAEALLAGIAGRGMSDAEKCTAAWRTVYHNRFWTPTSRADVRGRYGGIDPILTLNCFAPTICQQDAEMCVALWSLLGYSARVWQLVGHTTSEVYWAGRWRHFDATNGTVSRDDAGEIVGVAERHKWRGQKKLVKPGSFVGHTDGYVLGHRMELALRRGESFTRYWHPLSKEADYYVPSVDGGRPVVRRCRGGTRMGRTMKLRPRQFDPLPMDAAYASGVWVYEPDLRGGAWREGAAERRNVAVAAPAGGAYLHPRSAGRDAWVTFRVRSPYAMTGGWLSGTFTRAAARDRLTVEASADGGHTWRRLWTARRTGPAKAKIALREVFNGELDCLVRIGMSARRAPSDVRAADLRLETVVQANPFALPALKLGRTRVRVSAGPQLDRVTVLPDLTSPGYRRQIVAEKNVCTAREGRQAGWVLGLCARKPDTESCVIFKLAAPGAIRRLRWGGRFLGDNDANKLLYSLDGKSWTERKWTWRQSPRATRNDRRTSVAVYETIEAFPPGTREVWLKYWFLRRGPIKDPAKLHLATQLRMDADCLPATRGRRPPVEITYCWTEHHGDKAVEKTHRRVAKSYPTTYRVTVGGDRQPTMKWVKVQLARGR